MPTSTTHVEQPFSGILRDRETFGTGRNENTSDRLNSWFDDLMLQSGTELNPTVALLLCVLCAVACGGAAFLYQENLLSTGLALLLGFMIPILSLVYLRSRRQSVLMKQIPPMMEELARAARTGRSLEQCLQLVSQNSPLPLGHEMTLVSRRLQMGMSMRDAFRELPHRTGIMSLNLLGTSFAVHQQTGGDLAGVLERLSRTVRERLLYLGRLKAATAASQATAILMIVLPPAILAFFTLRDPQYIQQLFGSSWGRLTTFTAIGLEFIGALWVFRILRDSARF